MRPDEIRIYVVLIAVGGPFFMLGLVIGVYVERLKDWLIKGRKRALLGEHE